MNPNPLYGHINKIFIGSVVWATFYIYMFFSPQAWGHSLLGDMFQNSYSYPLLYAIQIVFFLFLNFNLYTYTIGKKFNLFDIHLFFKVLIWSSLVVLFSQLIMSFYDLPFHYGLIGFLLGKSSVFDFAYATFGLYILYLLATMMMGLYIALIMVYLFQVIKMQFKINFTIFLRFAVIFMLFAIVLGMSHLGFNYLQMILYGLYIVFAFIVYVKSKYNIKALVCALFILFIL